jgi:2,3,4,5-tetrahydropyridine-2-carboxylate N-succinyltransferase
MKKYINEIENIWLKRNELNKDSSEFITARDIIAEVIDKLDSGDLRVCDKNSGSWTVSEWIKKAILLSFKLNDSQLMRNGHGLCYDKVPPKFDPSKSLEYFTSLSSRIVPGSYVRKGAYIGKNVVLMPSFVNIGAYVDDGTMIDTWSTIGSCAQIGKNCHISGGVGVGGVLEPLQAKPVIIEDNCFIGARSEVAEGVIIEEGAVLSMGVYLGTSTKIFNRMTGEVTYGRVPAYSVVVPGALPDSLGSAASLYCAVIVKTVDAGTRAKTAINELLRDA